MGDLDVHEFLRRRCEDKLSGLANDSFESHALPLEDSGDLLGLLLPDGRLDEFLGLADRLRLRVAGTGHIEDVVDELGVRAHLGKNLEQDGSLRAVIEKLLDGRVELFGIMRAQVAESALAHPTLSLGVVASTGVKVRGLVLPHLIEVKLLPALVVEQEDADLVGNVADTNRIHIIEESEVADHEIAGFATGRGLAKKRRETAVDAVSSDVRVDLDARLELKEVRQANGVVDREVQDGSLRHPLDNFANGGHIRVGKLRNPCGRLVILERSEVVTVGRTS